MIYAPLKPSLFAPLLALAAMLAGKAHAAGGAVRRRHHILDGADEILKRRMHRVQIGEHLRGSSERALAVDHPLALAQRAR